MLFKKMLRDIRFNKSQFITIFLMVFIGLLAYSGIESYMAGMEQTANIFYEENNLQDLNIIGKNFTDEDVESIKTIEHVNNVERKLTLVATQETTEDRTLQMNFIESNDISKFYVVDGIEFDVNKSGVWLDEYYARNNDLKVGDIITLKYDGFTLDEEVLGLILVPDHVYDVKDESAIFPNHKDYGFVYLSINEFPESYIKSSAMKEAGISDENLFNILVPDFNYKEYIIYNYALVDVDNEENKNEVKNEIENKIENVLAVIASEDTTSYECYQGEIEEGKTYVGVFSGLFIIIAILSVITTMTRVVEKQRIQIGTLKALGFKRRKILMHYVGYGFWISVVGAILGAIVGQFFIGKIFLDMELTYFEVPNPKYVIPISGFVLAICVIILISFVAYLTCRKELKESAAETLRQKLPKVNKNSLKITTRGVFKKLGFASKWNLRDIIRNKMRTAMGIAGIASCCMLLVCSFGMLDSMNHFLDLQFKDLYNFDYKLTLKEGYTNEKLLELTNAYGEHTSQTLGIEIENGNNKEANNIFVTDAGNYVRIVDKNNNYINYPKDGIYVTRKLAENNGYKIGDTIRWHIYGDDTYYESKIVGFDKDPQNQNIKMTREYLESLGIEYKPDSIYTNCDLSDVNEIDGVEIIQDKNALRKGMEEMLNTMKTMITLIVVIAATLGAVIIYNLGILSFTEKQYQFATLKVLGFKNRQIKKIYIKQNNWITCVSIILGLPLGFILTEFLFKMALSSNYDFDAYIKLPSYLIACIGTFIVSTVVSGLLAKKVSKIDMVTSLKGNE